MNQENVIIKCQSCGAKNRVPKTKMNERPICGRCKAPLNRGEYHDQPVSVTDDTFQQEVLSCHGAVLLDCWAPWCGPCRSVAPVLDQLASEYAGRLKIAKLNVDENPGTASRYQIQSIPTMLFFKNGQLINRIVGALPRLEIERQLSAIQ